MSELTTLSDFEKCRSVFRAVCEGVDCELTYGELQALEENGFIEKLKRVRGNRWSFEWTDKLEQYAKATTEQRRVIISRCVEDI
jgi:hypothetical protein